MRIVERAKWIVTLSGWPRPVQIGVYSLAGVALGLAVLLVRIANATSYLSDDPRACINCHVMTDAYASWQRGSHGRVAVCIDCHVPHDNLVAKYAYKARDGLKHSYVFTMGHQPQVLNLSAPAVPVIGSNCVRCHEQQLRMMQLTESGERRRGIRTYPPARRPGRSYRLLSADKESGFCREFRRIDRSSVLILHVGEDFSHFSCTCTLV